MAAAAAAAPKGGKPAYTPMGTVLDVTSTMFPVDVSKAGTKLWLVKVPVRLGAPRGGVCLAGRRLTASPPSLPLHPPRPARRRWWRTL
jgi:hypothetical protein